MKAIRIALVGIALLAGGQAAHAQCVGDCNGNNVVAVNELVTGVNILLERAEIEDCPVFDSNSSGTVQVNELVTGVNNLLRECPPVEATNTPTLPVVVDTPTPTATTPTGGDTPTPTATFGEAAVCNFTTANSTLRLCFLGICAAAIPASGELGVQCGAGDDSRACQCLFERFDPVEISSVGFACVEEPTGATCPTGTQDCTGTTSVNIDLVADQDVGTCSSNAECASKCDVYCGALEPAKVRFSAGCENQCQGGTRLDQPCICDVATGATCQACTNNVCTGSAQACTTAADCVGVNDCPNSSCEGRDNELDVNCHCQCIDESFGANTPAGAMRCRLPTAIRIETATDCDNVGVLVRLPPLCTALTTGEASGILLNLNETTGPLEFDSLPGVSGSCAAGAGASTEGVTLVANLAFFDSTIGDIIAQLTLKCE